MKKGVTIIFIVAAGILALFYIKDKDTNKSTHMQSYEEKWGINLPMADKKEILWSPTESFFGDGEYVNAYHYFEKPNVEHSHMWPVVYENLDYVNTRIQSFVHDALQLSVDERKIKSFKLIEHEVEAELGDSFIYTSKNRANDYILVLYKYKKQLIYTLQSHQ